MKLKNFLIIKAFISIVFGVGFLSVPTAAMSVYGVTLDETGVMMVRFFGSGLIGIGLICMSQRNTPIEALKGILLALFIADSMGFVVALQAQLMGIFNVFGWVVVGIWLLLAIGLGYFRFRREVSLKKPISKAKA